MHNGFTTRHKSSNCTFMICSPFSYTCCVTNLGYLEWYCRCCSCNIVCHVHTMYLPWRVHWIRTVLYVYIVSSTLLLDSSGKYDNDVAQDFIFIPLHSKDICRTPLLVSILNTSLIQERHMLQQMFLKLPIHSCSSDK